MMRCVIRKSLPVALLASLFGLTAAATAAPTTRPAKRPAASTRPTVAVRAGNALPAEQDIRAAFEAGEYQKVVQFVSRVLAVKTAAAAPTTAPAYDRYELLTMRGEAYLHLRQSKSAGDSFALAARETTDDQKAATARAMQRSIREARGATVQRRGKAIDPAAPATADLLKPDERETAFQIVYDNLHGAAAPKIKAAVDARTLPPIVDALAMVGDLSDLAMAGARSDSELAAARQELGDRGRDLINRELDRMDKDVSEIRRSAETVVEQRSVAVTSLSGTGTSYDSYKSIRRGLTDKDRADLRDVMKTCEKIIPAAEQIARTASGTAKTADETVNRAMEVGRGAQRVLDGQYEGTSQRLPEQQARQQPPARQMEQPAPARRVNGQ